jgi:hypothetical protein
MTERQRLGKAFAAIVAAGIGCAALGVLTSLAELSPGVRTLLNFYDPVGPLSGKTSVAVLIWLGAWAGLAYAWRISPPIRKTALIATFVLIGVGFVGTFPPFFELFTPHQ